MDPKEYVRCFAMSSKFTIQTGVTMSGRNRSDIQAGIRVQIVQKQDQRTGKLTEGIVKDLLTKSSTHPHGIKVRLTSGIVGRVKEILPGESESQI